jgi:hypothetical protein
MAPIKGKQTPWRKFIIGDRPGIHVCEGLMFRIRDPLDGPVFQKKEDAVEWCILAMVGHLDRGLEMSEVRIIARGRHSPSYVSDTTIEI